MTAKKAASEPVHQAPMTFRDYPGEVPESEHPVAVVVTTEPEPVEPAKPATKKES